MLGVRLTTLLTSLVCCIAGLVALYAASSFLPRIYPEAMTIATGAQDFKELSGRFQALAQKKGAVYAFEILKRAQLPPNTDLHLLGHAVGDILYTQKGIDGVANCTQNFRNACSHAVVIGALNEFGAGDQTLLLIDDACKKAPGGSGAYTMCYHGLGHGVLAYFGYDLKKTVAFCKRMGTPEFDGEQYTQCVSGAIMELMGGGGHDHELWLLAREKYLSPAEPLAPCDTALIPYEAKTLCFIYLTPRLFELAGADLGHPDPATFPKAFGFCDALSDTKLRDACYGGFGKEFVPLAGARDIRGVDAFDDREYATAIEWCGLVGAKDGREACITEALGSVFWGGENDPRAALRFCSLVSDSDEQITCYTELIADIARYSPERNDLCAAMLEPFVDECTEKLSV